MRKWFLGCAWTVLLVAGAEARPFTVVAYNVENLFDLDGVAGFEDYGPERYTRAHALTKLQNAARVIARFDDGRGPDFLLLNELEADATPGREKPEVLLERYAGLSLGEMLGVRFDAAVADLPAEVLLAKALLDQGLAPYRVVVADNGPQARGGRRLEQTNALFTRFPVREVRSHPTLDARAILEVRLEVDGAPLHVFVNHWKSGASNPETEPVRVANARTLRRRLDEILARDPQADVIVGGDLNSQYNQQRRYPQLGHTGINDVLGSQGDERATAAGQRELYNLWHELPPAERGSDTFRGEWGTLMHLLVTRGLYDFRGVQYVDNSFGVAKFPGLNVDARGLPVRWTFEGPAGGGFSDHFPVFARFQVVPDNRPDRRLELVRPSSEEAAAPVSRPIGYAAMDVERLALQARDLPNGVSIRQPEYVGKLFRVEGRVARGNRLAVEFRGETCDVWSHDEALRERLRARHRAGDTLRFYGELGRFRDRWQFVIQDPSWVK